MFDERKDSRSLSSRYHRADKSITVSLRKNKSLVFMEISWKYSEERTLDLVEMESHIAY
jgi:hypothetical protein